MKKEQMLENRIRNIAEEIFASVKGDVPSVFDKKKWTGELMEWAMKDSDFKVRLLRFIDVLPSLHSDPSVVKVLKEYFADDAITPLVMKWGIKGLSEKGLYQRSRAR
jgi:RHH-type proline utilization regulon transcriptional repressor/proline dehydrogenase/delta 1-pyrroline-5-carboxylate dehydrogenase